jgi:hypothetical protein
LENTGGPSFALAIGVGFSALFAMGPPNQSITLSSEQVQELHAKLSLMRHDINNMLSLITAAVELIRSKPQTTERMTATLLEQPSRISNSMANFSIEFERVLGIPPT